tara:strand:- start:467 stop:685 length:219 start_codon:yes stop_codon:yes gene_type:complete
MAIILKKIPDTMGCVTVVDVEKCPQWVPSQDVFVSEEDALKAVREAIIQDKKSPKTADEIIDSTDIVYENDG